MRGLLVTFNPANQLREIQVGLLHLHPGQDLQLGVQHEQKRHRGIQASTQQQPVAL